MYATGFACRLITEAQRLISSARDRTSISELEIVLDEIAQAIAGRDATLSEIHNVCKAGLTALDSFVRHLEVELLQQLEHRVP